MANIKLVQGDKFISFDEKRKLLGNSLNKAAKFIYHKSQEYWVKGNPSEEDLKVLKRFIKDDL